MPPLLTRSWHPVLGCQLLLATSKSLAIWWHGVRWQGIQVEILPLFPPPPCETIQEPTKTIYNLPNLVSQFITWGSECGLESCQCGPDQNITFKTISYMVSWTELTQGAFTHNSSSGCSYGSDPLSPITTILSGIDLYDRPSYWWCNLSCADERFTSYSGKLV